ncbi:MAG: hypothetical protein Q7R76_02355 [Candidatus Woesearchaeota archaeon]|nr:hypothetical protein [Candidatus Woesearchaeota archaeon]
MAFDIQRAQRHLLDRLDEEYEHSIRAGVRDAMKHRILNSGMEEGETMIDSIDEETISGLDAEIADRVFIRENSPHVIGYGSRQIVLRLGNGAVAKANHADENQQIEGWHVLHLKRFYAPSMYSVSHTLREIAEQHQLAYGVPAHYYTVVEKDHDGRIITMEDAGAQRAPFVICEDLSEDGDKKVEDLNVNHFTVLSNGHELLHAYDKILEFFKSTFQRYQEYHEEQDEAQKKQLKPGYKVVAVGHRSHEYHPVNAINKMLLVQIDPRTEEGRIFCGDLDHLLVQKLE